MACAVTQTALHLHNGYPACLMEVINLNTILLGLIRWQSKIILAITFPECLSVFQKSYNTYKKSNVQRQMHDHKTVRYSSCSSILHIGSKFTSGVDQRYLVTMAWHPPAVGEDRVAGLIGEHRSRLSPCYSVQCRSGSHKLLRPALGVVRRMKAGKRGKVNKSSIIISWVLYVSCIL